jgi:regulator of sigma E protease
MTFTKILHFLFIALEVIAIFNLLIIVHELGHFLAARWRGLVVDEFGIWFGKPLWRKKIGGIWYSLGSIPAGGFVKLPQLADMSTIEGESETPTEQLPRARPLDKAIVAFAGPLFSLLLAFAMATVVWVIGKPVSEMEATTTIGVLEPGGPADVAGLRVGDKILEIDGKPVTRFMGPTNSIMWNIIRSEGATIPFKIQRGDEVLTINSGWTKEKTEGWRRPGFRKVLIGPLQTPSVGVVISNSAAAKAGLQAGDLITEANGQPVKDLAALDPILKQSAGAPLALTVQRDAQMLPITLNVPETKAGEEKFGPDPGVLWGRITLVHPGPWQQVKEGAMTIFNMVGALVSPKSDVKVSHFSGPVGIMRLYYQMFDGPEGWRMAIALSVLINVNLALLNLLPLPVLDGGHITLAAIEAVRRKPVNARLVEMVQTASAVLLIGFILFVTFFDLGDMFLRKKSAPEPAETSAPPAVTAPK